MSACWVVNRAGLRAAPQSNSTWSLCSWPEELVLVPCCRHLAMCMVCTQGLHSLWLHRCGIRKSSLWYAGDRAGLQVRRSRIESYLLPFISMTMSKAWTNLATWTVANLTRLWLKSKRRKQFHTQMLSVVCDHSLQVSIAWKHHEGRNLVLISAATPNALLET